MVFLLFVKKSFQENSSCSTRTNYIKNFSCAANYFLSQYKKINKHSFASSQLFRLPSSTGFLRFPSKFVTKSNLNSNSSHKSVKESEQSV